MFWKKLFTKTETNPIADIKKRNDKESKEIGKLMKNAENAQKSMHVAQETALAQKKQQAELLKSQKTRLAHKGKTPAREEQKNQKIQPQKEKVALTEQTEDFVEIIQRTPPRRFKRLEWHQPEIASKKPQPQKQNPKQERRESEPVQKKEAKPLMRGSELELLHQTTTYDLQIKKPAADSAISKYRFDMTEFKEPGSANPVGYSYRMSGEALKTDVRKANIFEMVYRGLQNKHFGDEITIRGTENSISDTVLALRVFGYEGNICVETEGKKQSFRFNDEQYEKRVSTEKNGTIVKSVISTFERGPQENPSDESQDENTSSFSPS